MFIIKAATLLFFLPLTRAFHCHKPHHPLPPPTSVYDLHPSQVDVILALGDSVTAAFGIEGKRGGLHEYRGQSWSIGGDDNATTLPNFIKHYNPQLQGYSVGRHEVRLCWGRVCRDMHTPRNDVLNAALSGAMIKNVVKDELDYLLAQLEATGIDLETTWKVLTLFVGANDVCLACHEEMLDMGVEEWEANLRFILDTVRDRIPRVFVNVVEMFNMSRLYDLSDNDPYCQTVHRLFFIECDCAFGPAAAAAHYRTRMDELAQLYNGKTREVVASYMTTRNDTFALSLHTLFRDVDVGTFPTDMVSSLDCFHPSAKSHAFSATALWNSMLTPPDERKTTTPLDITPLCPDEGAVFYPGVPGSVPSLPAATY